MKIRDMDDLVIGEPIKEIENSIEDIGNRFFAQFIGKFFMSRFYGKWKRYGRISNGFIFINNYGNFSMNIDYINKKGYKYSVTFNCDRYIWDRLHFFDSWEEMELYKEVS